MDEQLAQSLEHLDTSTMKLLRFFNRMMENADISRQQLLLLRTLFAKQKSTVTDLAEELHLSTSATTIALNRLVKNGYIIRTRDEHDRRLVWVQLTPSAIELMESILAKRKQILSQLLKQLQPEEAKTFLALLDKMIANIE